MNPAETPKVDGLVKQTMWLTVAKSIAIAMSLILPLVLVRTLNQNEFGLYKQAFQILSTLVSLLALQVAASVYYFMPREPGKKPQVAMNVLLFYGLYVGICWARLLGAITPAVLLRFIDVVVTSFTLGRRLRVQWIAICGRSDRSWGSQGRPRSLPP